MPDANDEKSASKPLRFDFKKPFAILIAVIVALGIGMAWAVHRPEATGRSPSAFTALTLNVGDVGRAVFPVEQTAAAVLAGGRPEILFLQEVPAGQAGADLLAALNYPYAGRPEGEKGKDEG